MFKLMIGSLFNSHFEFNHFNYQIRFIIEREMAFSISVYSSCSPGQLMALYYIADPHVTADLFAVFVVETIKYRQF